MTELHRYLKDDDPLVREPTLLREQSERMRRLVVAAAREEPRRVSFTALALVTGLSGMAALAVWTADERVIGVPRPAGSSIVTPVTEPPSRRQLQFATPGGTRVIWVFNSQFQER